MQRGGATFGDDSSETERNSWLGPTPTGPFDRRNSRDASLDLKPGGNLAENSAIHRNLPMDLQ
jgi:hypothetical protein